MNRSILFLFLISSALASCQKQSRQLPPTLPKPTFASPSRTLSVRTILTHSHDSTMAAEDTTSDFDIRDTIHGIIETQNALDGTQLLGKWYYAKTGQMIAENSATLSAGMNLSHFDLINAHPWPLGKYKLYVLVDSVLRDSAQFAIENKR